MLTTTAWTWPASLFAATTASNLDDITRRMASDNSTTPDMLRLRGMLIRWKSELERDDSSLPVRT